MEGSQYKILAWEVPNMPLIWRNRLVYVYNVRAEIRKREKAEAEAKRKRRPRHNFE